MATPTAQPPTAPAPGKNAVERRLDTLLEQWTAFAQDAPARVLAWSARDDERPMLNAFLNVQAEPGAEAPDFFLRLAAPLDRPESFASALLLRLVELYDEVRPQLQADGIAATWAPQADALAASRARGGAATIEQWLAALGAFAELYSAGDSRLAVSIEPTPPPPEKLWSSWLGELFSRTGAVPPRVRLIVADSIESPVAPRLLAALPPKDAARVRVVPCSLDMPAAIQELAATGAAPAGGGGSGGPGPAFRRLFVALTGAIGAGDAAGAARAADGALAVAREQGWPHLEAAVHMASGAGALGVGDASRAAAAYQAAGAVCARVLGSADGGASAGPGVAVALGKVSLHARLGEAAALYSGKKLKEAAAVYEATAPMAAALKDHALTLECWRMACHCHGQLKAQGDATRCGRLGLAAAAAMEPPARQASTLPYLARELAALHGPGSDEGKPIRAAIAATLGPDWEKTVAALDQNAPGKPGSAQA